MTTRVFDFGGTFYETVYDGDFDGFAARRLDDPDHVISLDMASRLFAANRYHDLLNALDADGFVEAARTMADAARGANRTITAMKVTYQPAESAAKTLMGLAIDVATYPLTGGIKLPGAGSVVNGVNEIGTEWRTAILEHGETAALIAYFERMIDIAETMSIQFRVYRNAMNRTDPETDAINATWITSAFTAFSRAMGTANTARDGLAEMEYGGVDPAFDSGAAGLLANFFSTQTSEEEVGRFLVETALDYGVADDLRGPVETVKNLLSFFENWEAGDSAAQRAELNEALMAVFSEGLAPLDYGIFTDKLAAANTAPIDGFQTVWDEGGTAPQEAQFLDFERDGSSAKAVLSGVMSESDNQDYFAFDVPEGAVLRFGESVDLFTHDGTEIDVTYASYTWTSPDLSAGRYIARLQDWSKFRTEYDVDVTLVSNGVLEADDLPAGASDLGVLPFGKTTITGSLGGLSGLDIADHYKITVEDPTQLKVTATGAKGIVNLRMDLLPLIDLNRDAAGLDSGWLTNRSVSGTANLAPMAQPYILVIEGGNVEHGYTLTLEASDGFDGVVETATSSTQPNRFGAGDDIITQTSGAVWTEGGDDTVFFTGPGKLFAGEGDDTVHVNGTVNGTSQEAELQGEAGHDTLIFGAGAAVVMELLDADGGKISPETGSFLDHATSVENADRVAWRLSSDSRSLPTQISGFEEILIQEGAYNANRVIYTPQLSFFDPRGYSSFYADWRSVADPIIWDSSGDAIVEVVDGFSIKGPPYQSWIGLGSGDDTVTLGGNVRIFGGKGNDVIEASGHIEAGDDDDTVTGSGTLLLGEGNDTAYMLRGSGTVDGGAGYDIFHYDMQDARIQGYFNGSVRIGQQVKDVNGDWVSISGTAEEIFALLASAPEWRFYTLDGKGYTTAEFANVEEIHIGGSSGGAYTKTGYETFYAFDGVQSVNGYSGTDTVHAAWSGSNEDISMHHDGDETWIFSNGFRATSVERFNIATGSGDDILEFEGTGATGLGNDTVTFKGGTLKTEGDHDTVVLSQGGSTYAHFNVDLGWGQDTLYANSGRGGTLSGGNGIDTLALSVEWWEWTDTDGAQARISATREGIEAVLDAYAGGQMLHAWVGGGKYQSGYSLDGFERIDQTGTNDEDLLIDFGHGSVVDGMGGGYGDTFFADWSDATGPVIWNVNADDQWYVTPSGGAVRNVEQVILSTGASADRVWLAGTTNDVETGAGSDYVSIGGSSGTTSVATGAGRDAVEIAAGYSKTFHADLGGQDDIVSIKGSRGTVVGGGGEDTLVVQLGRLSYNLFNTDGTAFTALSSTEHTRRLMAAAANGETFQITDNDRASVTVEGVETFVIAPTGIQAAVLVDLGGDSRLRANIPFSLRDTFHIGDGNDIAQGGGGSDSYNFYGSFGKDVIEDTSSTDTVNFLDARAADLTFKQYKHDLKVLHADGSNLTVRDYFSSSDAGRGWTFTANGVAIEVDLSSLKGKKTAPDQDVGPLTEILPDLARGEIEIIGGNTKDLLTGTDARDEIRGLRGNDILDGGVGDDLLFGGNGQDFLIGGLGADLLDGGNGRDVADYSDLDSISVDLLDGSNSSKDTLRNIEIIWGTFQADAMRGDGSENTFYGFAGADILEGRGGADTLIGGDDNDTLNGGGGNDEISGGTGDDTIDGSTGNDLIEGGSGDDVIEGRAGDDRLIAGAGNDTLRGGSGKDFLSGQAGDNLLEGGGGRDTILGGAGNDTVNGGNGADDIGGSVGDDILSGGKGNDTLKGSSGSDLIAGDGGNDRLFGGSDDDTLLGGTGNDRLYGEGGTDTLKGGVGNDLLDGGWLADILDGGAGNDRMTGGAGADTFVFGLEGKPNADVISDFNDELDRIQITNDSFTVSVRGNDMVLDWGSGETLTIEGFTNKEELWDGLVTV